MDPSEFPDADEIDQLLEDEDELDALREMESNVAGNFKSVPNEVEEEEIFREFVDEAKQRSPAKKKARFDSGNVLRDIGNVVPGSGPETDVSGREKPENEPMDTSFAYRVPQVGERKVFRRIPLSSDYQSVTAEDGERLYLRLRDENDDENVADVSAALDRRKSLGLCGQPYQSLLKQALEERMRIEEQKEAGVVAGEDSGFESSDDDESVLWVDKFRPRSYAQLLSDDGANRVLLHWLKLWDKVVFGRDVRRRRKQPAAGGAGQHGQHGQHKPANKPGVLQPAEDVDELDEGDRPRLKTVMLHGPPGLGKTTLAHVVARHAGYNVVEMNASDDRSLAAFKTKLDAATQMKSVNGNDQRPNCLVIDEIDGAPAATISCLVSLLTGASRKKTKKNTAVLSRPIICICNDLYVPALRPLRAHAVLVQFPPTSSSRLAQRLSAIAGRENLRTDATALMALCEKSNNDIRACLSTLQFFKSRGRKLRVADVHKRFVGQKDAHKSHFAVWQDLFQLPRQGRKRKVVGGQGDVREENVASAGSRFKSMLGSAMACGDYDKLQDGVFENYLGVKFKDARLSNVKYGLDWFGFFDLVSTHIGRTQNYSCMAYMPYNFVAAHFLFAETATAKPVRIAYPATAAEKKAAALKSAQLVDSVYGEMTPTAKTFASNTSLVQDMMPCLLEIIKPNLRAVNTQLYSAKEKEALAGLIAILVAYNLNYVQDRSPEGQYFYKLDPNIEDVAYFPDTAGNHVQLPYAIKQLISHEVSKERMRRDEPLVGKEVKEKEPESEPATAAVPSHLQKLSAKPLAEVKERVPVDFFGRRIEPRLDPAKEAEKKANEIISSDVWFKFKEGYNNAVRKTVRLRDIV